MKNTEFFMFEKTVYLKQGDGVVRELTEEDREEIKWLNNRVESLYPKCFKRLKEVYKKSQANITLHQHRIAARFCRCNFGNLDNVTDINSKGEFNLEDVICPLKGGFCADEGVICNPEINTNISPSEMRVLELVYNNVPKDEIANQLFLSKHTVNNHIRNAYTRIGAHEKADFIAYAHKHKLFPED